MSRKGPPVTFRVGDTVRVSIKTEPWRFGGDVDLKVFALANGSGDTQDERESLAVGQTKDRPQWFHPRDLVLVRRATPADEQPESAGGTDERA